jgi:hypothetical protein
MIISCGSREIEESTMSDAEALKAIDLGSLGVEFSDKPILVGGMALEYYGIRKRGEDFDFIVSGRDYAKLEKSYRDCRKDMWGDFGIRTGEYELFRSMYKFDYPYFDAGSIELEALKVVSIDMLLRMKVFAMDAEEKHKRDVELLKEHFKLRQNAEYLDYMNRHVDRYLKADKGLIINGDYY